VSEPVPQDPRYPHGRDGDSIYDLAGGTDAFLELVDRFYGRVEQDPVLRPMYPEDLGPGKRSLGLFLAQYWGGPEQYAEERGHPRLRMRHGSFPITREAASRWAQHMAAAIHEMRFRSEVEAALLTYVARFTPSMINTADEPARPHPDDELPLR
jgi:hemoglobin